tara:strand:- start:213 stop:1049 length:837 start_codon:yes stop_codon:yes gene_type:complete
MILTLLLLGGMASLAMVAADISSGSDDEIEEDFDQGEFKGAQNDTSLLDIVVESDAIDSSDYTYPVETYDNEAETYDVDDASSAVDKLYKVSISPPNFEYESDSVLEDSTDNLQDTSSSSSLVIDKGFLDDAPVPLSDWTSSSGIVKIDMDDSNDVSVNVECDEGRLHILQADYFERISSELDGSESFIHTGANVYFVPSGEEFPESYIWSESGASLYNIENFESDPQDFGGIKFVSRIDTGFMYGNTYDQEAIDFQKNNYEDLQVRFRSNVEFNFSF